MCLISDKLSIRNFRGSLLYTVSTNYELNEKNIFLSRNNQRFNARFEKDLIEARTFLVEWKRERERECPEQEGRAGGKILSMHLTLLTPHSLTHPRSGAEREKAKVWLKKAALRF